MIDALRRALPTLSAALMLAGCDRAAEPTLAPQRPTLFKQLSPAVTGVTFENRLDEAPEFNILNYLYYYNGGGVAVGDVDGDGRQDIYFSSNVGENTLYRNLGGLKFENVTAKAGVQGPPGWKTGVSMADVNGDGHVDLYVSAVNYLSMHGHNVLYVNDGDGTFTDRTAEYGLTFEGFSTQALFFDYDGDGDLDLYLLNHSVHTERQIGVATRREVRHPKSGDRLYRQDATPRGPRFTDVSALAGIYGGVEGYGLGVVASDINNDGCPDLYVANDFQENDFLYVNNCNGTFTESITQATQHTSRFSMGVDAADMNDDGRPDLMVVDMLPEQEAILKSSASSESFNLFEMRLRAGYHAQYPRNTLQLNRGNGHFSEIGYLAGVFASDWSWAPLFADLDNDGRKDLFITNGIFRRPNDLDYINYVGNDAVQSSLAKGLSRENAAMQRDLLGRMPQIALPNHAFRNDGALRFTDQAAEWGLAAKGFSNGAVYVDLDDDGALDLVVNRINAPAAIYHSRARTQLPDRHYLQLRLQGNGRNRDGIGAKVIAVTGTHRQLLEQQPVRGFQSSVSTRLHFGLGTAMSVDTLTVIWPDKRMQTLTAVRADRSLTLVQDSATQTWRAPPPPAVMLVDAAAALGAAVAHVENDFLDYNREPLMPHVLSSEGPAMAVGDVNGDGRDDLYVGGAKWQAGTLLLQQRNGHFVRGSAATFATDSLAEDVDALFFDADGDRDLDLYVVSGGNEFWDDAPALRDRLYLNDGRGAFTRAPNALPADFFENGGAVTAGDIDGDGDLDLFVGSRVVSRLYGITPRSHLLQNDGRGRFTDVTRTKAVGLDSVGMVASAQFVDVNGDKAIDLVVVGEWMPVRLFVQRNGMFEDGSLSAGLAGSEGWWNSVTVADLNADGAPDLVLGNLGLNAYIKATAKAPARMYLADFTNTGTLKQLITFNKFGVDYPIAGRDDLVKLMPTLRPKYQSYRAFGAATLERIFDRAELQTAVVKYARTFASAVAMNDGTGRYTISPLPAEAQLAPVYATVVADFNHDGAMDVLVAGNQLGVPPMLGRYDASRGTLLYGNGHGDFTAVDATHSGVVLDGQIRALALIRNGARTVHLAVARNNASLQLLRLPLAPSHSPP